MAFFPFLTEWSSPVISDPFSIPCSAFLVKNISCLRITVVTPRKWLPTSNSMSLIKRNPYRVLWFIWIPQKPQRKKPPWGAWGLIPLHGGSFFLWHELHGCVSVPWQKTNLKLPWRSSLRLQRPAGYRVKFRLGPNSIKYYDKANCLRIETTINEPSIFKVYGEVHHRDGTTSKQWKPRGKSISNLYRYAEVAKASNSRYINSLQNLIPVKSVQKETLELFRIISGGKYLLSGFTNKAVCQEINLKSI